MRKRQICASLLASTRTAPLTRHCVFRSCCICYSIVIVFVCCSGHLYVEGLRKRKEYDELQHSERSDRSKQFRGFVDDLSKRLKVPKDQLYENQYTMPPNQLLQLDGSIRNQMRAIDGVKIPCENTLSKLKMELAVTHGTMTGEFLRGGLMGAYMSDPLTFLQSVSTRSQFLCIGGDAGNGVSKLGVTYTNRRGKQKFQPLLVYAGKDDWESLEKLKHEPGEEPLTPFFGATRLAQLSGHSINDIWDLFQYVKDTCRKPVYLNGDMAFLLTVQGCKTASSLNPCPICIVAADKTRSDALRLSQQLLEPAARAARNCRWASTARSTNHSSFSLLMKLCPSLSTSFSASATESFPTLTPSCSELKSSRRPGIQSSPRRPGNREWLIFSGSTVRSYATGSAETSSLQF